MRAVFDPLEAAFADELPHVLSEAAALRTGIREGIEAAPSARIDYVELSDPLTLEPLSEIKGRALVSLAVFIGKTRLIDNLMLGGKRTLP